MWWSGDLRCGDRRLAALCWTICFISGVPLFLYCRYFFSDTKLLVAAVHISGEPYDVRQFLPIQLPSHQAALWHLLCPPRCRWTRWRVVTPAHPDTKPSSCTLAPRPPDVANTSATPVGGGSIATTTTTAVGPFTTSTGAWPPAPWRQTRATCSGASSPPRWTTPSCAPPPVPPPSSLSKWRTEGTCTSASATTTSSAINTLCLSPDLSAAWPGTLCPWSTAVKISSVRPRSRQRSQGPGRSRWWTWSSSSRTSRTSGPCAARTATAATWPPWTRAARLTTASWRGPCPAPSCRQSSDRPSFPPRPCPPRRPTTSSSSTRPPTRGRRTRRLQRWWSWRAPTRPSRTTRSLLATLPALCPLAPLPASLSGPPWAASSWPRWRWWRWGPDDDGGCPAATGGCRTRCWTRRTTTAASTTLTGKPAPSGWRPRERTDSEESEVWVGRFLPLFLFTFIDSVPFSSSFFRPDIIAIADWA